MGPALLKKGGREEKTMGPKSVFLQSQAEKRPTSPRVVIYPNKELRMIKKYLSGDADVPLTTFLNVIARDPYLLPGTGGI